MSQLQFPINRLRALTAPRALWAIYGPSRAYATDNAPPPPPSPSNSSLGGSPSSGGSGRLPGLQNGGSSAKYMPPGVEESVIVEVCGEVSEAGGKGTPNAGYVDEDRKSVV